MKIIIITFCLLFCFITKASIPPIIEKILNSGNGKSIDTAYKVNSVQEEYDVIWYLQLRPITQKLHIKGGYFYDEIKTDKKTLFFKIIAKKLN